MADGLKKILLVEDNPDHSFVAQYSITIAHFYEVDTASNGRQALEMIKAKHYDLALVDYNLPDIDGLTILKHLIEDRIDLPVVMITGLGSESVAVDAMKIGAYDYVIKTGDYFKLLPFVINEALGKHRLLKMLEEKATKDIMTGVYNRNHFHELYERELSIAKRYRRMLTVAMIDINHFKWINDTHGHAVGDQVLMHLGAILNKSLRSTDIVARYGGDEFVVVMLETGPVETQATLQRIRQEIDRLNQENRLPVPISVSIGVSYSNSHYDHLLSDADEKMYEEKKQFHLRKKDGA